MLIANNVKCERNDMRQTQVIVTATVGCMVNVIVVVCCCCCCCETDNWDFSYCTVHVPRTMREKNVSLDSFSQCEIEQDDSERQRQRHRHSIGNLAFNNNIYRRAVNLHQCIIYRCLQLVNMKWGNAMCAMLRRESQDTEIFSSFQLKRATAERVRWRRGHKIGEICVQNDSDLTRGLLLVALLHGYSIQQLAIGNILMTQSKDRLLHPHQSQLVAVVLTPWLKAEEWHSLFGIWKAPDSVVWVNLFDSIERHKTKISKVEIKRKKNIYFLVLLFLLRSDTWYSILLRVLRQRWVSEIVNVPWQTFVCWTAQLLSLLLLLTQIVINIFVSFLFLFSQAPLPFPPPSPSLFLPLATRLVSSASFFTHFHSHIRRDVGAIAYNTSTISWWEIV